MISKDEAQRRKEWRAQQERWAKWGPWHLRTIGERGKLVANLCVNSVLYGVSAQRDLTQEECVKLAQQLLDAAVDLSRTGALPRNISKPDVKKRASKKP